MKTSAVEVDYRHTRQALQAIFDLARAQDVEKGGRYDARSGAINIYTHPCNIAAMQEEGTPMSSLYAFWAEEHRSWRVEMEEGFSFRSSGQLAGKSSTVTWRTIWRNQGATFSPAVVAAFWTCSWRLASTER